MEQSTANFISVVALILSALFFHPACEDAVFDYGR